MPLITMGERGQVTIPGDIRRALALEPGTILEAHEEDGRIILETQEVVSRTDETLEEMLTESLAQADRGETAGPFKSIDEWEAYLDSTAAKQCILISPPKRRNNINACRNRYVH
ncbi:MAG: AbrB/MazE/SpoVT family DNA-binding domain-containing protein [Magnetococcales bacterium]|nr:AbrB/MazE/SpoVT family DNA-binding domain-containing protein [Magnetococcales bacterium]